MSQAFAQATVTRSPDPLTLDPNAVGAMTATLSEPAPAGGAFLYATATPGTSVIVSSEILVPEGFTAVTFDVQATAQPGVEQVSVTLDSSVDSATVIVGDLPETFCKKAVTTATHAARAYIKALGTAERLCVKSSSECDLAIIQTDSALNAVIQA